MLLTSANLAALNTSFSASFQEGYTSAPQLFGDAVAMDVPGNSKTLTFGFIDPVGEMREWIGPREIHNLVSRDLVVTARKFEKTIGVEEDDIADDNLGIYSPRMELLGYSAARFRDQLLIEAIAANAVGFDGVSFFNASHPLDPAGVQSNLGSETFDPDGWQTVRSRMQGYTGADGLPMRINPNLVLIPPAYERMAKHIFQAPLAANGGTNVQNGEARYIVVPEWAGTSQWYALASVGPVKPFVFFNRQAPRFVAKDRPTDDNAFFDGKLYWGVDARGAAAGSLWFLAHKSTGAVSPVTQLPAAS